MWNIRAWTFQERLLCRRLIVFTHGQITWHLPQDDLPGRYDCRRLRCALSTITVALAETSAYGRGYREQVDRWQHRDHAVWRHLTHPLCRIRRIHMGDRGVYLSRYKLRVRRLKMYLPDGCISSRAFSDARHCSVFREAFSTALCFRSRRGSFNAEAGFPAGRGLAGSAGWRTMSCSW